jgi:hypothetical protein
MTLVPTEYSTIRGNSLVQPASVTRRREWYLPVASTAGGLAASPDYDQFYTPLSNHQLGSISEEWEVTQPRAGVHFSSVWEGMNVGFEHTRLKSSTCFGGGNSMVLTWIIQSQIHQKTGGKREWGEVLRGLPQAARTDGGFREYAGQRRRYD